MLIDPIKTDIRVIKTKKAIRDATLFLLAKKNIDDISITELATTAQINRKTFYNYYQNIHQVIDEIENETVEKFASAIKATDWFDGNELDFRKVFFCVTESVRDNMEFFRYLLIFLHPEKSQHLLSLEEVQMRMCQDHILYSLHLKQN